MRKIKLITIILAFIITISFMPANVLAVAGLGTESSPYIVTGASDLEFVKENLSAHYKLGANVTLSSVWSPIGTYDKPFTGSFDGNGHTISGLKISQSGNSVYVGLFGYSTGNIKNLKVTMATEGIRVTADKQVYAGGIVGYNNGGTIENCSVEGTITVDVSASSNVANVYSGMIAGRSEGDISFSDAKGSVTASVTATSATKTAANDAQVYAGGIAGQSNADLHDNSADVAVLATATGSSDYMAPKAYAGGIAGKNTGNVTECQATGNVTAKATGSALETAAYAGGLVGFETGNIEISTASGAVVSETSASAAKTYAGGLVGYISGNISKTFATGTATSKATTIEDVVYAGGLAGLSYGKISSSYALGTASATATNALQGGLVGFTSLDTVDCYYKENAAYNEFAGCGIEKSDEELKIQETFSNWDFATTWGIKEEQNSGYPYLVGLLDIVALFEDVEYTYDGTEKTIVATSIAENISVTYTNNKATKAGVYKAVATLRADGYADTQLTANLIIKPKVVTITGLDVKDKEYDNTTKAEIDISNAIIEGVIEGDDVAIDAENSVANFVTDNVGDNRRAVISEIKFIGEDAQNYTAGIHYAEADIYEGEYDHVEFEGSGTKEDPYLISDQDELNAIRGRLNAHYKLTNNIILSGNWVPIGRPSTPFEGSFDGNNYTISGISVDQSINYTYSGLFGYNLGTINNLKVLINDDIFTTANNVNIGGIAGYNGGIITNCIANGRISTSPVSTYVYVGGIAGYNGGTISYCDSNIEIAAKGSTVYAGGVAGENTYLIEKTSSAGSVTVDDALFAYAGGFVGINNSLIKDSYSLGNVLVNISDTAFMVGAGGFAGRIEEGNVTHCYSVGKPEISVDSGAYLLTETVGGFTSYNAGIMSGCYYDRVTTGLSDADKGTPKTTDELKTQSTFTNWNFEVWGINTLLNNGYPYINQNIALTEKVLLGYENKTVTISAYMDIIDATLIVASYSENGALVDLYFDEEFTIDKGETKTEPVNIKELAEGVVKVMLWKDFESAMPLCTHKTTNID